MNILYISVHSILEGDEIRILLELGHNVFSLHGAYSHGQGDDKRPPIKMEVNQHLQDVAMQCSRENIHPEIIEWADVIIWMHRTDWIHDNWSKVKHKKNIWRTIGQCTDANERDAKILRKEGLKIVRMSPTEETIPDYLGSDALIRFCKDDDEFNGWTGNVARVVNVSQAMFGNDTVRSRGDHMGLPIFKQVTKDFNWKIFGPDNDFAGEHNGGLLTYEDYKNMLRFSRVYFYTGTEPSPYTLAFIEAFMTGIPVVSIGKDLWITQYKRQQTFEIDKIIENGKNGYISNSIPELRGYIQKLLEDQALAKSIGEQGRLTAIKYFAKGHIREQWDKFLKSL